VDMYQFRWLTVSGSSASGLVSLPANASGGACTFDESGGDVGGAVLAIQGDQDFCASTGAKGGRTGFKP
jgi:hypothetical protein